MNVNQNEIAASKIVAKAVLKLPNGEYETVVLFSASTRYQFYWFFLMPSKRSPRKKWISRGYQIRTPQGPNMPKGDFRQFVQNRSELRRSEVVSVTVRNAKLLKLFYDLSDYDFDIRNSAPRREPQEWETRLVRQRMKSKLRAGASAWNR